MKAEEHAFLILSTPEQFRRIDVFAKRWNMTRERTAQALLALGLEVAERPSGLLPLAKGNT